MKTKSWKIINCSIPKLNFQSKKLIKFTLLYLIMKLTNNFFNITKVCISLMKTITDLTLFLRAILVFKNKLTPRNLWLFQMIKLILLNLS